MPMLLGDLRCLVHLLILFLALTNIFLSVLSHYYPSANLSTSWTNNLSNESWSFSDGSSVRPIILKENAEASGFGFGFGFFRNGSDDSFLVVFFVMLRSKSSVDKEYPPEIVWCANRDNPIGDHARLELTGQGNLVLEDNGNVIWSTSTSGLSVTSLALASSGNLMLLKGSIPVIVWQSFDHPTDTWLPHQKLYPGQRLTARTSKTNYSSGLYYLSVTIEGIHAFIDSDPPYIYRTLFQFKSHTRTSNFTVTYLNGLPMFMEYVPKGFGYVRLEPSGHLNANQFLGKHDKPTLITNFLEDERFGDCAYPTVCGNYGICSEGQCSCPLDIHENTSNYFKQLKEFQPNRGCEHILPLSCKDSDQFHTFLEMESVTYFDYIPSLVNIDKERCKRACLSNCSCKAALFRYRENNASSGGCFLQYQLSSFMVANKEVVGYSSYAFIKVQGSSSYRKKHSDSLVLVFVPYLSMFLLSIIFVAGTRYCSDMRRKTRDIEEGGDDLVIEAWTKFSFQDLKAATQNFQVTLGRGGFGSAFDGILVDGTKVAVKRLESADQGRKEFLAEVNTMGSTHHFNLLRLIGYCAEKSNRLLVYEHMCNGSLDKWIFNQERAQALRWETRRKIIVGIAKGLEYLHVHCNPHIIHFDIKPQNILLDENFNVKIADFGLAKLIDKDKSQVLTALKGTPGYMAPELFRGVDISVKTDVYSFGIVILEIVCGRRNLDPSQFQTLIDKVNQMVEENRLRDLLDEDEEDIQFHQEEALKMIEIAIWCLQIHDRRPFISNVVKILDGLTDVAPIVDSHFLTSAHTQNPLEASSYDSTPPVASILSGPRE